MELLLVRTALRDTYTIGKLYINGVYFSDIIEDKDRGLDQNMTPAQIRAIKVPTKTAIPTGTYNIVTNIKSPRYSLRAKYVALNGGYMPRLEKVPGYEGVLIHPGATADDSAGCLCIGKNTAIGRLTKSWEYFVELDKVLRETSKKGEKITIKITRK